MAIESGLTDETHKIKVNETVMRCMSTVSSMLPSRTRFFFRQLHTLSGTFIVVENGPSQRHKACYGGNGTSVEREDKDAKDALESPLTPNSGDSAG